MEQDPDEPRSVPAEFEHVLSPQEIYDLTHYRRPAEQIRELAAMGVPARRRHDNTVCVLRADVRKPSTKPEPPRPQLRPLFDKAPKAEINRRANMKKENE